MKKTLIGLALLTTAAAGAAIAQVPPPGDDPMGGKTVTKAEAAAKATEMFAKMDVNNDGKIDQADRAAHRTQMFDRLDSNKDGTISRDEYAAVHSGKDDDAKAPGKHRMGKRGGQMGGAMMMLRFLLGASAVIIANSLVRQYALFEAVKHELAPSSLTRI